MLFTYETLFYERLIVKRYIYIYILLLSCLPVVDELVNAGVIGADVGFGKLPYPAGGGIDGGCDDALRTGSGPG